MEKRIRELLQLKKETKERVKIAREMGDLSENGAYKYGKFELGNINRELRRLNYLVEHAELIHQKDHYDSIELGATFTLESDGAPITFTLVNEHESDPAKKKLSDKSPLGQAALGKRIGETVTLTTPRGTTQYVVTSIGAA